jgi:hypothetical protein
MGDKLALVCLETGRWLSLSHHSLDGDFRAFPSILDIYTG